MWARVKRDGTVRKVYFRPQWVKTKEAKHPPEIFSLWTPAERAAIRIYPIVPGAPIDPSVEVEVNRTYAFDGTNVIETINKLPRNQEEMDRETTDKKYASDVTRLHKSDMRISNMLEDLIQLLVDKGIIVQADLSARIDTELKKRKRIKRRIKDYEAARP